MITEEVKQNKKSSDAGHDRASEDEFDVYSRFEEAHQGIMGLLFAAYKMKRSKLKAAERSLPLTIIGGFLGSGKTTLLNHLLTAPHGLKLVVLVNDFGKINIDAELVASKTDDMINLSNGCACCAVAADLTDSLIKIAEREERPDAIVLEASGIAEPYGVMQVALSNPAIRIDGNLVVVDAETIQDLAGNKFTRRLFRNQISVADLVILSKVDLLDEEGLGDARKWVAINYPDKQVIEAAFGDIPADVLLGIGSVQDDQTGGKKGTYSLHHEHHADDFESLSFTLDEPLDRDKLLLVLKSLPKALLRAKGVLNLSDEPGKKTIYQRVGQRWDFKTAEPWGDEKPHSNLVFVGTAGLLVESELEAGLKKCLATGDGKDLGQNRD